MWLGVVSLQVCVTLQTSVTGGVCDVLVEVVQSYAAAEQKKIHMYSACISAVAAFLVRVQLCMFENGFAVHRVCLFCVTEGSLRTSSG